jgi:hypothetical protein
MVVSFGRSSFRLDEDNVALALEAATGGFCGELKVSSLSDRVFFFAVSCKVVGFKILARKFYSCPHFKCYFHLWGSGGPNWIREHNFWQRECTGEWIIANRKRNSSSDRRRAVQRRPVWWLESERRPTVTVMQDPQSVVRSQSTQSIGPNLQFGTFDPTLVEPAQQTPLLMASAAGKAAADQL